MYTFNVLLRLPLALASISDGPMTSVHVRTQNNFTPLNSEGVKVGVCFSYAIGGVSTPLI